MKRSMFRLLAVAAVVALAGLASSCGGGDDDEYSFGGRWAATLLVTQSNLRGLPVGYQGPDVLIISQNGSKITSTWQSVATELTMSGTCDPKAKTFSAAGVSTDGIYFDVAGSGTDDDTMSGTWSMRYAGIVVRGTWIGDLASRAAAAAAGAGVVAELAGRF